ncbi:NAD(P)H-hydrate dehydratase [Luteolibacter yonseiensis]
MLAAESSAMADGWTEEQLLDLAGERLGRAIGRYFPHPGTVVGYLGKGHNAGDTLVALRILRDEFGWDATIRNAWPVHECSPLVRKKWDELGIDIPLEHPPSSADVKKPLLLLDGLLGTGTSGPLREPLSSLAAEMSSLRNHSGARIASVDLPSGINADTGEISPDTVTADITFMIGNAKHGLLTASASSVTGALAVVDVPPLAASGKSGLGIVSPQTLPFGKSPRPFDFHKGQAGRVAILAGSEDYTGAAVLAATGALSGGGGLITLFTPRSAHALVAARCPPEIIVRGIENPMEMSGLRYDSLVVGCGLGEMNDTWSAALTDLIARTEVPTVVDADALNHIAKTGKTAILNDRHILTPHPGEFARLAPDLTGFSREEAVVRFANRVSATLLLKGSRTLVTAANQPVFCNSTGTPGMATGGQGDLLTGVIGARLANGDTPVQAAALSAWLCGRAAEIALNERHLSEESLAPSDVSHFLGAAFRDWKSADR